MRDALGEHHLKFLGLEKPQGGELEKRIEAFRFTHQTKARFSPLPTKISSVHPEPSALWTMVT